ncbi:hypothetical protein BJ508DRAFT_112374 [Ascobolus immersus RN42]|uniref:Uncharacterized protein n=1 Tax=Ascobolus immersus RN42 TaxID=1160509 RepID=A0A3N4I7L1_ASCIM|nr:hypothetical protein BJ508DRAFT_112374 [Ascobolus immersus RN42]
MSSREPPPVRDMYRFWDALIWKSVSFDGGTMVSMADLGLGNEIGSSTERVKMNQAQLMRLIRQQPKAIHRLYNQISSFKTRDHSTFCTWLSQYITVAGADPDSRSQQGSRPTGLVGDNGQTDGAKQPRIEALPIGLAFFGRGRFVTRRKTFAQSIPRYVFLHTPEPDALCNNHACMEHPISGLTTDTVSQYLDRSVARQSCTLSKPPQQAPAIPALLAAGPQQQPRPFYICTPAMKYRQTDIPRHTSKL